MDSGASDTIRLRVGGAPDGSRPGWLDCVETRLGEAPDPPAAARLAEQLLALPSEPGGRSYAARMERCSATEAKRLADILFGVCAIAPFLASFVRRHPDWLGLWLADDLSRGRGADAYTSLLEAHLSAHAETDPALALRRFKYFELGRITIRDAQPEHVPISESAITLTEVSALADALLAKALEIARAEVAKSGGPARWRGRDGGAVELGFCVLGLGKLGSSELNYSSDVDLVYVHETPAEPLAVDPTGAREEGFAGSTPAEYFGRVAQSFGKLVSATGIERFLYRIDLDLRPLGAQGSIVIGEQALDTYFEAWADTWERAAYMKARPVAGDTRLGWRVIRSLAPMLYLSSVDYSAVEGIRSLKGKVEVRHGDKPSGFNVKIDAGGIRDVEFIAQTQQLLHGGRINQIRERSTQQSLRKLAEVGLLEGDRVEGLLEAYRFLRRVENRIQMEDEQQRHVVPAEPKAMTRLARAVGFTDEGAAADFAAEIARVRALVRSYSTDTCAPGGRDRILDVFVRSAPQLVASPAARPAIEQLAEHLAREIDASAFPDRALNNLDRFIQGVGRRRFYYELLLDRPELVPRLVALFSASRFLSSYLAAHPRLIEPVFEDPDLLVLSREQLERDLETTVASLLEETGDGGDPTESELDALRIFQHRQILNVGLLDIAGKISSAEAERALSEIAEVCLARAVDMASRAMAERSPEVPESVARGRFLVVGMGKLGSRELSYGSDLDLIFLYDLQPGDEDQTPLAQEYFIKLTQRLISALRTATAQGTCYEIDARLRPSGNQGSLVTSMNAMRRYHDREAANWERQALLRARPVAGDETLGATFMALREEILRRPLPDDLAQEIDHVRGRMESELAKESGARRNFKTGRGGLVDVETVVQYLILRHGNEHPELLEVMRVDEQLDRLEELALVSAADARVLRDGWTFIQRLSARLRIVENRSISDLDAERGDLEGLARGLGYDPEGHDRSARRALLDDYRHHTEAIRAVYASILQAGAAS